MRSMALGVVVTAALSLAVGVSGQEPAPDVEALAVTFQLNDAFVKDRVLPGVAVIITRPDGAETIFEGETDLHGRCSVDLPRGVYAVSYAKPGYVPVQDSVFEVRSDGQIVTTTLSMMLEAEGSSASRRVRVILNWGSDPDQVRDADSHVICPCGASPDHVYFAQKEHEGSGHAVDLDVDDVDWGGPETITLSDPVPGAHVYWVHDYSGPPAVLGRSDVVVRVLFGDTVAAEFHVPRDLHGRAWRPFEAIVVEPDLRPRIARFTADDLAAGLDRTAPQGFEVTGSGGDDLALSCGLVILALVVGLVGIVVLVAVLRRR